MGVRVGDFREGAMMVELLAKARREGQDFDAAWAAALHTIRRGRSRESERWVLARNAFRHHKDAWRRAYYREQPTKLDDAGLVLRAVMDQMYDDSDFAAAQFIAMPEAA